VVDYSERNIERAGSIKCVKFIEKLRNC